MSESDYIPVSEFVKLAGVTRQAIHLAKDEGRIKKFKKIGPIFLIHKSEVKKFKGAHHGKS